MGHPLSSERIARKSTIVDSTGAEHSTMTAPLAPIALSATAVFAVLALLHVYWAFGGQWGLKGAIPEADGKALFRPGRGGTLAIAFLLVVAGTLVLDRAAVIPRIVIVPRTLGLWGTRGVATALTGRAVGDFNYVGFFKRQRTTVFARLDTRLLSPLALALGVAAAIVAWRGGG
jgi:Protein of unknown function (DUF3995)